MLEFFRKKKHILPDLGGLITDMHSHLLPGIDDGSPDVETSIALIRGLTELGYKKFITTPHIFWDLYKNTPETIQASLAILNDALEAAGLSVNIRAAAEYYMDEHFDELLNAKAPLLALKGNMVLVETSFVNAPFDLKEKLFKMQIKGYQPVLAHAERYVYFMENKGLYDTLKDAGCLFQLNILSLTNYYGRVPTELANYLIGKNYIDFLGTDLHHQRHLEGLQKAEHVLGTVQKLLDSGKILNPGM